METLNIKHELQIEVLTPLNIGAGAEKDWVKGSDFIVDNNEVKILNLKKVSQFVNITDLTNALLMKNDELLVNRLNKNLPVCIDKTFKESYFGNNDIKTCIKNSLTNKPIVPGSSIKGALRSILLDYLMDDLNKKEAIQKNKLSEQEIFGKASFGDEFMRFIKVSDAAFESTGLVNTKIFNLRSVSEGGWKHAANYSSEVFKKEGFNSFYEVIEPKNKSQLTIGIANKAFHNYAKIIRNFSIKKNKIIDGDINEIFFIINSHTKRYLEKEKAFFTKYATDKTDRIINSIDDLINQIPKKGEYCIFKMAAGSGFHSITGDWQFEDFTIDRIRATGRTTRGQYKKRDSSKSRKIAIHGDNFTLMGFIKIKVLTDEEIRLEQEATLNKILSEENKRKDEELARAEQLRIMRAREEAERIEKIRIEQEKIQKEKERITLEKKNEEQRLKLLEEEEKRRIAKREKDIKAGLSFLTDSHINDFKNAKNRIDQFLKKANIQHITNSEHEILFNALISFTNSKDKKEFANFESSYWKKVISWVGKETAQKWFNEMNTLQ